MSKYPEHEKLKAKEKQAIIISGFLDFLEEQDLCLGKLNKGDVVPIYLTNRQKEKLIGDFLGIDVEALHKEKDDALEKIRFYNQLNDPDVIVEVHEV